MTNPVKKVETYTGATLDYSLTDEVVSIHTQQTVTDKIGLFQFVIPTKAGVSDRYTDIALNDIVKIYLGYDTVPATPTFVGKVATITGEMQADGGYIRRVGGFDYGATLLRRLKKNKYYDVIDAANIVNEIIDDLQADDLAHDHTLVGACTTDVSLEVVSETYFDLLRTISDYWYDATPTKIQRDFYVNTDKVLVWNTRPLRAAGVESFAIGNIISYSVLRDVSGVRNNIKVYGANTKTSWAEDAITEDHTTWTEVFGTLSDATDRKVGATSIYCTSDGAGKKEFYRPFTSIKLGTGHDKYKRLTLWYWMDAGMFAGPQIRLLLDDTANWLRLSFANQSSNSWKQETWSFHKASDFDDTSGTPDLDDCEGIYFIDNSLIGATHFAVDGVYFSDCRFSGSQNNAASITAYGQRDLEVIDDRLLTDNDCAKRAEAMLMQLKDPVTQLEFSVSGNTNVLVGDQLTLTVPAEAITAAAFDVLTVDHYLTNEGFLTKATTLNTSNLRAKIETTLSDAVLNTRKKTGMLGRDRKIIG